MLKKSSKNALCLGALVIMTTLLVSSEAQRYPGLSKCTTYAFLVHASIYILQFKLLDHD